MSRPLCEGCCFWFASSSGGGGVVAAGAVGGAVAAGAVGGAATSSQSGGCCPCCVTGGTGGGGGGAGGGGGGCCFQFILFLNQWFWFFIAGLAALTLLGFILLIVGISYIANAKESTVGEEFISRNALYAQNAKTEIESATGTVRVGNGAALPIVAVNTTSNYKLSGVARTWSDSYISASIPAASFPTTGNIDFTLSLSYTCSACVGTETVAPAVAFTSTSFPVSNGTGWKVNRACVVIYRTHKTSEWILDPDQASCFYPFDSDSNKYSQTASSDVELIVRSKYDFGYFWLEEQSEGTLDMADGKILLVDPSTPSLLGAGAALLAIGIIGLCTLICMVKVCFAEAAASVAPTSVAPISVVPM